MRTNNLSNITNIVMTDLIGMIKRPLDEIATYSQNGVAYRNEKKEDDLSTDISYNILRISYDDAYQHKIFESSSSNNAHTKKLINNMCIDLSIVDFVLLQDSLYDLSIEQLKQVDSWFERLKQEYKLHTGVSLNQSKINFSKIGLFQNCDYIEYSHAMNSELIEKLVNSDDYGLIIRDLKYKDKKYVLQKLLNQSNFKCIFIYEENELIQNKLLYETFLEIDHLNNLANETLLYKRLGTDDFNVVANTKLKNYNLDSLDLITLIVDLMDSFDIELDNIDAFESSIKELILSE